LAQSEGHDAANAVVKILPSLDIEIVKRPEDAIGFKIIPKRWIVEPTIASAGSPRIGSASIARRSLSCASLPSGSCSENYAIRLKLSGQTLKPDAADLGRAVRVAPS
jgi:hypothetical protein